MFLSMQAELSLTACFSSGLYQTLDTTQFISTAEGEQVKDS